MEVSMAQYPPGDPRLVDKIVGQLKSQGIFDRFRKECIADVDTKPAYQNLHQRVETSVSAFLAQQEWKSDLNKNQVRDSLRKHIHESGFLDIGVERIVDQVVNPKIMPVFLPQIEDVVYSCLGIEKPKKNKENFNVTMCPPPIQQPPEKKPEPLQVLSEMLPKDLDPISPESDTFKDDDDDVDNEDNDDEEEEDEELDNNDNGLDKSKVTEEEESSPPFEPIERIHSNHDSNDSNLSDISGLSSEDSQISDISFSDSKKDMSVAKCPVSDAVSQDSQLSKVSSNSRLSMEFSDEQKESSKILANDNKDGAFSQISEDSLKQKFEGIASFSQQHVFSHSPHVTEEHQDKSKDVQINEEVLRNKHSQSNTESIVNKLQKCEFDFADSASIQTEETAKNSIDENDSQSQLYTGMESCNVSEAEVSAAKPKFKMAIFSSIFKDNKIENQDNLTNKSGNDYSWDDNLNSNYESLEVSEQSNMAEKHTDNFGEDNVNEIYCSEGHPITPALSDIKQKNIVPANSTSVNFKNEDTETFLLKDNSLDGYSKMDHIDIKSDTQFETDTDTKDSQSLQGVHHYDSIQESFNTNDSQLLIGKFKEHEGEGKSITSMGVPPGDETKYNKQFIKEGHNTKQLKCETEIKSETDMSHDRGSSLEEVSSRKENIKEPHREQGKKEHCKDNSQSDRHTKDGTKERSRSEKEITKDRSRHDKLPKDSSKEHMKHDDRKSKEGTKDHSKRDDSRERNKQNERKERSKRDDKEISKDKHKHEERSDRERSRHDSKSEKEKIRDHSRHDEKNDRNTYKDRKEAGKDSSRRDKSREDKSSKTSEKDKGKQEEKSDKYKTKIDEKSKSEKEKARNENSSSKLIHQDAEQKEKHKSDSKRSKDKYKSDKAKHVSDGKPRKSNDDKPEKEITNKEDQKEKMRDQYKTESGESAEKSHKDKQRIHEKNEKDRKGHDKSRESSSSSSSRKSDKKGENKSQKNENKDKEKKKENKSKSAPDDHFVHRDKNSEDRRSTDRDSNGTSCDKSRGKSTESQSSQKQEKKSSRHSGTGKTEGGVTESQDTNAKSEECNEDDSPSKSPESSPSSLLPLKKRPLHQHSESEEDLDEYSCSNDSGKLVLKLKKPKIAANIFEIKKIMQLRKSMAKIENRNRYHNGKHSEIKDRRGKQQNDTEISGTAGVKEGELQSSDPVGFQVSECEDALTNDEDKLVSQEGIPLPAKETVLQNVKQNTHMHTDNETVPSSVFKPEEEDSPNEDNDDHDNSDVDGDLTHFEQASAQQTENLAAYIRTYEENLYSNPICFTDCSDSDNEETSTSHSLSHLKCKVVKEIVDKYVRQHFGFDSDLTVSVTEENSAAKTLRSEDITGQTYDIPTSSKSKTNTGKDVPGGIPKKSRTAIDSSGTAHYETNKNIVDNSQSSSELNHAKFDASATSKKLPKGYVLEWVPMATTDIDSSDNNAAHSHKRHFKRNGGGSGKTKSTGNIYKQINTEQKAETCVDKISSAPSESALERVSAPDVSETPHLNSEPDNSHAVNCTPSNGPDNRYVIADSDEDEYVGDEKSNVDNNIDKSSSDDEKVPLSADLIFHSLRDLMLESGMQKQISPEKVIGITENLPKPASEPRRNLLGRSRRPGLGRPAPGKGVVVDNSNSRTSTPDFVMPLSPESDVSASSGEQNKKIADNREAGNIGDGDVDTVNLNQEESESKRTLRSATTAYRGQRYSSDELYKPRPLFNVTSRRAKSKQQSPPLPEEVTVKKRRSTVEGCESSHSEKGTYR
ncbi:biorientation of chromosomes in cell division protein 1-like 1 [Schistocerca cancellata]|uniref:biorientation of chromosomes in cell division protein 1-like 1 n=1 Tax=Schistocerca cancellata TaxID=274614 RepID=UPI00211788B7|nr:biorientation of chromosomes in cell division protein 1-like 1 [Schistocerca cancellata]